VQLLMTVRCLFYASPVLGFPDRVSAQHRLTWALEAAQPLNLLAACPELKNSDRSSEGFECGISQQLSSK
jgi:hypothetical protein